MSRAIPVAWAAGTALLVIAGTVFDVDIEDALWILSPVVHAWIAGIALATIVLLAKRACSGKQRLVHAASATLVVTAWAGALIFASDLSTNVRFGLLRPYYEARLRDVHAGVGDDRVQRDGSLVAFYCLRGVTDNWMGLIHDPSGNLRLPDARGAFSGDMIHLVRLDEHWFLCSFT